MDKERQFTAGSRSEDGNVPNMNFNPDNRKVNLNNVNPENRNPNIGVRRVVSNEIGNESNRRAFYLLLEVRFQILSIFCRLKVPSRLRLLIGL